MIEIKRLEKYKKFLKYSLVYNDKTMAPIIKLDFFKSGIIKHIETSASKIIDGDHDKIFSIITNYQKKLRYKKLNKILNE